jgi:ring-1,2-phenylacetyl-CoA epoxidase subunit PaaA
MQWKIKRETNDDLRQQFIDKTIPQAELIGLKIPDKNAVWNTETNQHDTSDLDWDEFWNVIKGNGPCNKQRLAHHKKAHNDGLWVRDAAQAYAKKQNNKLKTA